MKLKTCTRMVTSAAVAGALVLGGVAPGAGASTTAVTPGSVVQTAPAATVGTTAPVGTGVGAAATGSTAPSPYAVQSGQTRAVPLVVRLAIRAGMEALKRFNRTWYNAIRSQLNNGRTAFVNWWNNSVPTQIKNIVYGTTGGLSGNALYDALLWVFGLG